MQEKLNAISESNESTVVYEYKKDRSKAESYQSEAELENVLIGLLQKQGYEYLKIKQEVDLINNLRLQLEMLNDYHFTDNEWNRFFKSSIANGKDGIVEKTRKIQEDNIQAFVKDNGKTVNISLIDKVNVHNNRLQVINQYETDTGVEKQTVPQIGWNNIDVNPNSRLLKDLGDNPYVYFVHSYYLKADNESDVAATTDYGIKLDVAVEHGNIMATQFHPEKSSDVGLKILKNFINI